MVEQQRGSPDAARGALCGLAAAFLFGVSTPAAKWLLGAVDPQLLAGLFYLAAGLALSAFRVVRSTKVEAPLRKRDAPLLGAVLLSGGVVGPLLLLVGLGRITATAGALLLNLEAPFTMAIALLVFREHLSLRQLVAATLVLVGAGLLKVRPGEIGGDALGMLSIAAACFAWAIDNNLTQRLAFKDPIAIVRVKTLGAGAVNVAIALARGATPPPLSTVAIASIVGAASYGLSIVLDTYALRWLGAAREAALFATAPFVGAAASVLFLGEPVSIPDFAATALMAGGVFVLLRDPHSHLHKHEPIQHEHAHVHDEHHRHDHPPGMPLTEPHSHAHRHDALEHAHPHASDLHHRHEH